MTNRTQNPTEQRAGVGGEIKDPVRLIALSDGLFATVLTLLVLDLRVPETAAGSVNVTDFIRAVGPHLFSYLLTFVVSGSYWMAHHRDFDQVTGYDSTLLRCNLLFLLFVGLFPFSTAAISLVRPTSSDYPIFWAIYAANVSLAGLMLSLTWRYAVTHGLVRPGLSQRQLRHVMVAGLATPAVFVFSIMAEYVIPAAFLGPYTLLLIPLVVTAAERVFVGREPKPAASRSGRTEVLWWAVTLLPWVLIFALAVWTLSY